MIHKLQQKKSARQTLISLYGINKCTAIKIIGLLGLHPQAAGANLFRKQYSRLLGFMLSSLRIGFRLRLIVFSRLCILLFLGTYRGLRLLQGLPSKGQRTHSNGKTAHRLKLTGNFLPINLKPAHAKALAIQRARQAALKRKNKYKNKNNKIVLNKNMKNKNMKNTKKDKKPKNKK